MDYCENPSPDNVLIVGLPKLDANAKKSKWFKKLESIAGVIQVWPIESNQLNGWIARRMKQKQLSPSPEAVSFLADKVEGNMLAAAQEIEKLALLYEGDIDLEVMAESVADSAKFDVFSLVESALKGDPHRVSRVLNTLRASGVEPVLIHWALTQEIRKLQTMAPSYRPGPASEQLFRKYGVWSTRIPMVRKALERVRPKHWTNLLCHAARIDRINKGMAPGNSWDELLKLGIAMGGTELMREQA
jgi:DNA polymerase-3 subunit delta